MKNVSTSKIDVRVTIFCA